MEYTPKKNDFLGVYSIKSISRILSLSLPRHQTAFLWGPRKIGKSTYLKERFSRSLVYDFLNTDIFFDFTKNPALLREQLLAKPKDKLALPIILDEVQKVPAVLDEVHWLIENKGLRFILCGSSARKLKRGAANLLGGRAWRYEMFPLVWNEIKEDDLLRILNQGTIPLHYLQSAQECKKSLHSYVQDYLKEEVFAEGLVRNLPAFSRFFDALRFTHGELVNYSNIARDCGIDAKTVKEYFQILTDTLLASLVEPYQVRHSRDVVTKAAKFYLFDLGVAGALQKRTLEDEKGMEFGRAFEHFIWTELKAYSAYSEKLFDIRFWRSKSGHEVDFILGSGEVALEVKGAQRVDPSELKSIHLFAEEYRPKRALVVCNEKMERIQGKIHLMPWRQFLERLWEGKII